MLPPFVSLYECLLSKQTHLKLPMQSIKRVISLKTISFLTEMKRSGPAMPPQPRSRIPKLPAETQTVLIGAFYGIVYSFDPENKWQTKIQDYMKINFVDKRNDVDCTYQILAADSEEKVSSCY